jgi:hypothetical protein
MVLFPVGRSPGGPVSASGDVFYSSLLSYPLIPISASNGSLSVLPLPHFLTHWLFAPSSDANRFLGGEGSRWINFLYGHSNLLLRLSIFKFSYFSHANFSSLYWFHMWRINNWLPTVNYTVYAAMWDLIKDTIKLSAYGPGRRWIICSFGC